MTRRPRDDTRGGAGGSTSGFAVDAGAFAGGSIRTGKNEAVDCGVIEMPGILSSRANRSQLYSSDRHTPFRSATAAMQAPGATASSMIRSLTSVGQFRRRSTVEMISAAMCLTVLTHVRKDTKPHDPHRARNPSRPQS